MKWNTHSVITWSCNFQQKNTVDLCWSNLKSTRFWQTNNTISFFQIKICSLYAIERCTDHYIEGIVSCSWYLELEIHVQFWICIKELGNRVALNSSLFDWVLINFVLFNVEILHVLRAITNESWNLTSPVLFRIERLWNTSKGVELNSNIFDFVVSNCWHSRRFPKLKF